MVQPSDPVLILLRSRSAEEQGVTPTPQTVPTHIQVDSLQQKLMEQVGGQEGGGWVVAGLQPGDDQGGQGQGGQGQGGQGQGGPMHCNGGQETGARRPQVEGILAVHEFHIWQLAGDRIIASAHVRPQ